MQQTPPRSFDSAPQALCHVINLPGAPLRMTILWEFDEKHPKQVGVYGSLPWERLWARYYSFFRVEESAVDIGPELPEHECRSVQAHVCQPALTCLGPGALRSGIVEIGDA